MRMNCSYHRCLVVDLFTHLHAFSALYTIIIIINITLNELRTVMNGELGGIEKEVHFKLLSHNSSC